MAAPNSTKKEFNKSKKAGITSQKLILLRRGNIISILDNIGGTSQFPNPPIKIGITKKNIIIKPCAVIIELYKFLSCNTPEGIDSSRRIRLLKEVPTKPLQTPKIKYKVPISLWLVDPNQRNIKIKKFLKKQKSTRA